MTAASAFDRLANHILESAEQIATRFEEGLSIVMTGKLPGEAPEQQTSKEFDHDDVLMEMDEDMMGSPPGRNCRWRTERHYVQTGKWSYKFWVSSFLAVLTKAS